MKIKLKNGLELDVILVNGGQRFFQGSQREYLEFQFDKTITQTLNDLNIIFSNSENTSEITILNDEKIVQSIQNDYIMKMQISLINVEVIPTSNENNAVNEERYSVTMAQLTYIEKQLQALGIKIN